MYVLGEGIEWHETEGIGLERADVLEQSGMAVKMLRFEAGGIEMMHRHEKTQVGHVIRGRFQVIISGEGRNLGEGDFYCVPAGTEHGVRALTPGVLVETTGGM